MASFFVSYVTAALATLAPGDIARHASNITPDTMAKMKMDCERFCADNSNDLAFMDKAHAGKEFWRARNGAMGFWDNFANEPQQITDRLTNAAKAFGPYALSVNEDGVIVGD